MRKQKLLQLSWQVFTHPLFSTNVVPLASGNFVKTRINRMKITWFPGSLQRAPICWAYFFCCVTWLLILLRFEIFELSNIFLKNKVIKNKIKTMTFYFFYLGLRWKDKLYETSWSNIKMTQDVVNSTFILFKLPFASSVTSGIRNADNHHRN